MASASYGVSVRAETSATIVGVGTNLRGIAVRHAGPGNPCTLRNRISVGHSAVVHGCTVKGYCLIGINAAIHSGAVIGTGSLVAAGAAVLEGTVVPPRSRVDEWSEPGPPVTMSPDDQLLRRLTP
jgi:carbonic anhydrase/acetyltransferase-like protein (isoleucine patch superfamily)